MFSAEHMDIDPEPYPRYGQLVLSVTAGGLWALEEPFEFIPEFGARGEVILPGFTTDLVSLPPFARRLFRTWGKYSKPAVVHDYMYKRQMVTRSYADRLFLQGMKAEGVGWLTRHLFYWAVRVAVWRDW